MSEIIFYPLDITYRIKNDKAVIHIYGKTIDNKRICVTDPKFQPYFVIEPRGDTAKLKADLLKLKIPYGNSNAQVVEIQDIEKNINGKPVKVLKVITKLPYHVPIIKQNIKNNPDIKQCYEFDILFTQRYIMDTNVAPLLGAKATGKFPENKEESNNNNFSKSRVTIFEADSIERIDLPQYSPRILAFDIETYVESREVNMEKNPILMIAFHGNENQKSGAKDNSFKKIITWKKFPTTVEGIEFQTSEKEMLQRFKEIINEYEPDIFTGYNSDGFDLPYIIKRAKINNINIDIGLDYSNHEINDRAEEIKITGIIHLDLYQFIRKVLGRSLETDSLKLNDVAFELLKEKKHEINFNEMSIAWDKHPEQLEKYALYNMQDTKLTLFLCLKILPNIEELVKIIRLTMFDVSRMSFSRLVESYIFTQCKNYNEVAPNKPDENESKRRRIRTYEGGFVFQPTPGLFDSVAVFDFRSLYPSIIISHNVSEGTYKCECCKNENLNQGKNEWYCSKKRGFLPSLLEDVVNRRGEIKTLLKTATGDEVRLLEARSQGLKLLANSYYGYMGFAPARWYSFVSAQSVTALGRGHIQSVIKSAQESGFSVIYSDTDSIFLQLKDKTKDDAKQFVNDVNKNLPGVMELDYEGFYPSALFVGTKNSTTGKTTGAKKKYAMLDEKGKLKIRGFETVRRNVSKITKEMQLKVLEMVLKKQSAEALIYVKQVIKEIRSHTLPVQQMIITTKLTRPVESYESIGPHVAVARRLIERGIAVSAGTIIPIVITEGKGIIRERAKHPDEVQNNSYDSEYYINNQIVPAVERVFEVVNINIEQEISDKRQTSLSKFFG